MRAIVHWDADSFFAAIEQAADRHLRGRPVAVGGPRRGVVLSASGEARRYGVRAGMPTGKARRACPRLVVVPGHFDLYEQFSRQILMLCEEQTPLVEAASVGAAWLDLTGTRAVLGAAPEEAAGRLVKTVREWLRVTLSTGVAANKTVARIAARVRKPGARLMVPAGEEAVFLAPLGLGWLPGLGGERRAALEVAGLRRIGELARAPLEALELVLGRDALALQRRAQGVDEEPVGRPKAVEERFQQAHEFAEDEWDEGVILGALRGMVERLMTDLRAARRETRRLTLTLRYTDREESERSLALGEPTALDAEVRPLLAGWLEQAWRRRVRLRGMRLRASRIYTPSPQMALFAGEGKPRESEQKLAAAMDGLRRSYGAGIIRRGAA